MKNLVDRELLDEAEACVRSTGLVIETPLLGDVSNVFALPPNVSLYLKLENMQTNGSFKLRGVINQFEGLKPNDKDRLVTFSAGNYGKAFAFLCKQKCLKGKVLMPETAAESRAEYIRSLGVEVQKCSDLLADVDSHVKDGWKLVHPLDDLNLIAGYSPMSSEILNQIGEPDIVLVCCGGGSLLAGVSAGFALNGSKTLVYGVEPETASTMKKSLEKGEPIVDRTAKSIASGLAPPMAGKYAYEHCKRFVRDILVVNDEEIVNTCRVMFEKGLKVEPSGCAGMAALLTGKLTDLTRMGEERGKEKLKIVVIVSGGNISADELANLIKN